MRYGNASIAIEKRTGFNADGTEAWEEVSDNFSWSIEKDKDGNDLNYTVYHVVWGETGRENWMVNIPANTPTGKYRLTMSAGTWSGNADFYVIFDPYATTMPVAERKAYAYNEDANGYYWGGDEDKDERDARDAFFTDPLSANPYPVTYILNPFKKDVTDFAVCAAEGTLSEVDAHNEIKYFSAHLICDGWGFFPPYIISILHPTSVDLTISNSINNGITLDMVLTKNIPSNLQLRGECLDFNAVNISLSRAMGLPSRFASGQPDMPNVYNDPLFQPSGSKWRYHAWTEGYVDQPPTRIDKWYIFDATDYVETENEGVSKSRYDYGILWDPQRVWVADDSDNMNPVEVTDHYYTP